MGRPKKTDINDTVNPEVKQTSGDKGVSDMEPQLEAPCAVSNDDLPADVADKMRLYPQYEEIWITPRGFVHPLGVPQYLLAGAKRYKNIFYNK